MKRLALLTVFFYVCTFAAPQRAQAVVPVAIIAAAAIGTAMMSSSIGAYYAQNGVLPQYVSTAANAVGSAADKIFQPAYLAVGPVSLVTMASFPHAASVYLGQQSAIGAKLGDFVDYVQSTASDVYTNFKQLLSSSTTPSVFPSSSIVPNYSTVKLVDGSTVMLAALTSKTSMNRTVSGTNSMDSYMLSLGAIRVLGFDHTFFHNNMIWWLSNDYCQTYNGQNYYYVWTWSASIGNYPTVNIKPDGSIDYPTLKDKLLAPPAGVASEIPHILKGMPDAKVVKADAVPATSTAATTAPALTQANVNDAIKANTAKVAQAAADAAAATATANPTDAAAQIAAAQAAVEAAKAAAEAAEAANDPEPEPEPSFPVPSTWYTKTCDLSQGLDSCINYQQVLNASHAFQSTALYQFPNLILQCLGYVQGDGCEYPPKISIDLFTRFSTGPINIDLSPFESVVKVMKFFFSILCLIGTGKATMTLFE